MRVLWVGCLLVILSGCAPIVIGAGAATGYMALQERGLKTSAVDTALKAKIMAELAEENPESLVHVVVLVQRSDVVLAGTVPSAALKRKYGAIIQKNTSVRRLYNHLDVQPATFGDYSKDTWVSTRLKSQMLSDKMVSSINYHIATVAGSVYVLGIAQNKTEKERVLSYARQIKGVAAVYDFISYK